MPYKDPIKAKECWRKCNTAYRERNRKKILRYQKAWRKKNPEKAKRSNGYSKERYVKYEYGISLEEYDMHISRANGKCNVCSGSVTERPHLDHCHRTGVIRGVLCGPCNMAIGLVKDNPSRLRALADYLEPANGQP